MATQKVVVGESSVTAGQMSDFWRQVGDGSINGLMFQTFLEHRSFNTVSLNWLKASELLGLSAEYVAFAKANEVALAGRPGLWTVPMLEDVTCDKVIAAFKKLGVIVYQYADNLDAFVTKNDRDPNNGSYIVSFASNIEADENLKGLSANVLAEQGVKGTTLLERLVLGLGYFLTFGKHLDQENITLCSGSRFSDGDVPSVYWDVGDRKLCVHWYDVDSADDGIRARAAVAS